MKTFLLLALLITFSSLGEILVAKGMQRVGNVPFRLHDILRAAWRAISNRYLPLGIFFLALSFFTFLSLLSYADLSYVVPLTAISYITNTIGAKLLLKETITKSRWIGTLLVAGGVSIISLPAIVETVSMNFVRSVFYSLQTILIPSGETLTASSSFTAWLAFALRLALLICVIASFVYYLISIAGLLSWSRDRAGQRKLGINFTPPVSILIPVRGADAGTYETFAGFCRQNYPDYQVIFGVRDSGDPAVSVIRKLQSDFPDHKIELVISPAEIGHNAKVSNLQNMSERARHDHLIIVDSDIRVGPDYLRRVIAPLQEKQVGMVTCLYRGTEARTFAARLENVGLSATFGPEVLSSRLLEGIKFALGSTIAMRRDLLEQVGGFQAIADYLADDFLLGNFVAAAGYKVVLSDYVVAHVSDQQTINSMLAHQLRWARSVRVSRPKGYAGLILSYGTTTSLLLLVALNFSAFGFALTGLIYLVRLITAWLIGVNAMQDRTLIRDFWLIPLRDWLGFIIWIAGFIGNRIQWRGTTFIVLRGGKIQPVSEAH